MDLSGQTIVTLLAALAVFALGIGVSILVTRLSVRMPHNVRSRRRIDGLCPNCGYDLRASRGTCPECGSPVRR